ncbi:hypothetical protein, partial [Lysinibacillus xylanilyticus]|uniref:hypothetical protein n=1 Tax=Lysinibacillus xylanilyticus TaxID=582475 RepID=UPI0036DED2C3
MQQENQQVQNNSNSHEMSVAYSDETTQLSVPMNGNLEALLAMKEMKEIIVHGKPILINASQIE